MAENGVGTFYPNMRRYRAGLGEQRRQIVGTECLDDNTYANNAIKKAIGVNRRDIANFDACHIWPQSCYDSRCHTAIANLVLLPRPLAGLSDHDPETQAALQFRSYELYKWCPAPATSTRGLSEDLARTHAVHCNARKNVHETQWRQVTES